MKNQTYLGSEQFVERMHAKIDCSRPLDEISHRQRRCVTKPLPYFAANFTERDLAIAEAYRTGAYSMQVIADCFGAGRMTVSRAVKKFETDSNTNVQWEVCP